MTHTSQCVPNLPGFRTRTHTSPNLPANIDVDVAAEEAKLEIMESKVELKGLVTENVGIFQACYMTQREIDSEGLTNPTLEKGSTVLLLLLLCMSRSGDPPGFCNGLDWRALAELHIPNIAKIK